jgi:hypothetical protein
VATAGAKHENARGPGKLTLPLNASNRANDPLDREIGDELRPAEENISPFGERPKFFFSFAGFAGEAVFSTE